MTEQFRNPGVIYGPYLTSQLPSPYLSWPLFSPIQDNICEFVFFLARRFGTHVRENLSRLSSIKLMSFWDERPFCFISRFYFSPPAYIAFFRSACLFAKMYDTKGTCLAFIFHRLKENCSDKYDFRLKNFSQKACTRYRNFSDSSYIYSNRKMSILI